MSPKGVCGDKDLPTIVEDQADDGDLVHLTLMFQWDGVSVPPACRGQLTSLFLRNNHDDAVWQAVFDRTGQDHSGPNDVITIDMGPNSEQTLDPALLSTYGLSDISDSGGIFLQPKPA